MANKFFLGILIISSFVSNILAADPQCSSGWEPYKKNCIKIASQDIMSYEEAKSACNGMSLLTIHSKEEQAFVTDFLFKNKSVVENIWLGLVRKGDNFEWSDQTKFDYDNWLTGIPGKNPDRNCFQLLASSEPAGKWSDSPCTKKNYVVCQGPPLTLDSLQTMISESLKPFKKYLDYLMSEKWMKLEFFKNTDGKQKAFFIPSNNFLTPQTWDEAGKQCKALKADIVDMDSPQKQLLLLSYLTKLGSAQDIHSSYIWLNGHYDTTTRKVKWNSGNDKSPTLKWIGGRPDETEPDKKNLAMEIKASFSQIQNIIKTTPSHVICEMFVNF